MMIPIIPPGCDLSAEIRRRHVDERQELYTIARALRQPFQKVRQIAQDSRIVLHQLTEFCTRHRGARLLLLDLETTGLPRTTHFGTFPAWTDSAAYAPSRIVQLAYATWTLSDTPLDRGAVTTRLRRPEGFVCTPEAEAVHGLTQSRLQQEGTTLATILDDGLAAALRDCDFIVAHNAGFDVNILRNECYRTGLLDTDTITTLLPDDKVVCTCKLTQYTKLGTLHDWFYPGEGLRFHDAGEDVWAVVRILAAVSKNCTRE